MDWLRYVWIGLAVIGLFSLISVTSRVLEKRETSKKQFVANMVKGVQEHRDMRFVGSFQTFDWLTLSNRPNVIFAMPMDESSLSRKPATKSFMFSITTYGASGGPKLGFANVDCKSGFQQIVSEDFSERVTPNSAEDQSRFPRWIDAFCGDWSAELRASKRKPGR